MAQPDQTGVVGVAQERPGAKRLLLPFARPEPMDGVERPAAIPELQPTPRGEPGTVRASHEKCKTCQNAILR
ncbi:MAG: hypothetical protein ACREPF_06740 [Rhodanobacteraceae bacterium]